MTDSEPDLEETAGVARKLRASGDKFKACMASKFRTGLQLFESKLATYDGQALHLTVEHAGFEFYVDFGVRCLSVSYPISDVHGFHFDYAQAMAEMLGPLDFDEIEACPGMIVASF